MTLHEFATATGRPYRTIGRWVAAWHAKGVAGIEKVKARGQGGAWRIDADVLDRWLGCELVAPHS